MTGQVIAARVDFTPVQEALAETTKNLKAIQRATLRVVAKATAKQVRAAIVSSDLHVRTGELRKAYTFKVKRDVSGATIFPRALSGGDRTIFPKAMTLSYGHEGPTKRAKNWRIVPRGFVQRGQQYAENGQYMDEVQKLIDKELEKFWS